MRVKIIVFSSLWKVLTSDSFTSIFRIHISFHDWPNSFKWPTDGLDTSCCRSSDSFDINVQYCNTGCRVFNWGIQNWKDFCLKININYWILRIGLMGRCQKVQNHPTSWLSKSIFYIKLSESFSIFFSLKNINLGAHFLLMTFFDNINF